MNQKSEYFNYLANQASLQEFEEIITNDTSIMDQVDELGRKLMACLADEADDEKLDKILIALKARGILQKIAEPKASYTFECLIRDPEPEALGEKLAEDPTLVSKQDEYGRTLLHHLAQYGECLCPALFQQKLDIIVNTAGNDFNIKSNNQNTPVHIAALMCGFQNMNQFLFKIFLKAAVNHGFDFETFGEEGKTVLQIASSLKIKTFRFFNPVCNVTTVINNVPNLCLNTISPCGATALSYALSNLCLNEAQVLVKAGANPMLYKDDKFSPLFIIQGYLNDARYNHCHEKLREIKGSFTTAQGHAEIRKNARLLAQGFEQDTSFLFKMSAEMLVLIAAYTDNGSHSKEEASNIAVRNFGRP